MLILSRKPGDAILIDGGIRIVVVEIDGGGVRLGIEAPPSVGILREEIARNSGAQSGAGAKVGRGPFEATDRKRGGKPGPSS